MAHFMKISWTMATSTSQASLPDLLSASSFSRISCEPALPGPVCTVMTWIPGCFWASCGPMTFCPRASMLTSPAVM